MGNSYWKERRLTRLIRVVVSYISEVEGKLNNWERFRWNSLVCQITRPDQLVRIQIENLSLDVIEREWEIVAGRVDLKCRDGREGEVGGIAGELGRYGLVKGASGWGNGLIFIEVESWNTRDSKCKDDTDAMGDVC